MIQRNHSSRRRKASCNQLLNQPIDIHSKGRRASVATDKPIMTSRSSTRGSLEGQRSPRGSVVPDIALDVENAPDEAAESERYRVLPDPEQFCGSRSALRSPRHSLVPDDYYNESRKRDIPLSPRNSLVPEMGRAYGSRHSLVSEAVHNKSPRNSLVPSTSAVPGNGFPGLHSSRYSLASEVKSPRGSVVNLEFVERNPRNSIYVESPPTFHVPRSPRGSITPLDAERSRRGSAVSDCHNQSPRGSMILDPNRSPRASIAPDSMSPRGSICPDTNHSPRGSIGHYEQGTKSPRGSNAMNELEWRSTNETECRSSRNSIVPENVERISRGSLGGIHDRRPLKGPILDPRRSSADQGLTRNRSSSPYRQKDANAGSIRSGGGGSLAYGPNSSAESRRPSSSVSQFSGDESRRLFTGSVKEPEKTDTANFGVPYGVTYGSILFQFKDASLEANGTCDFVIRALRVMCNTYVGIGCVFGLLIMFGLMFIFGLKFWEECMVEPQIPVYMVVGGALGVIFSSLILYSQVRSKVLTVRERQRHISLMNVVSILLFCFLVCWLMVGSYWILRIMWPDHTGTERPMYAHEKWCHGTLYKFSLGHLFVVYSLFGAIFLLTVALAFFRIMACPLPER